MRSFWIVLFLGMSVALWGQSSAKVKQLEKQRKAALAEIEQTSQLLKETQKTTKN